MERYDNCVEFPCVVRSRRYCREGCGCTRMSAASEPFESNLLRLGVWTTPRVGIPRYVIAVHWLYLFEVGSYVKRQPYKIPSYKLKKCFGRRSITQSPLCQDSLGNTWSLLPSGLYGLRPPLCLWCSFHSCWLKPSTSVNP